MVKNKQYVVITIGILLLASAFLLWPLLREGFFISDDGEWMVIRLSAFVQSLREGQFPVRFLGRLNHSYGYPVANFLYPGFLYAGSLLRFFGLPYVVIIKLIIGFSIIASSLVVFAWLRSRFKLIPSFIGAMGFIFSPYIAFDIYTRGSIGEIFAFLPASLGLLSISAGFWWLIPLAIALLVISHNSLALLFLVILGLYILLFRKWGYIGFFILGIGMSTFFWFPAIYERQYVIFDSVSVANPLGYFLSGNQLFFAGIPTLLIFITLLGIKKKRYYGEILFYLFVFGISLFFAIKPSEFLWSSTLSKVLQFPYRFLAISLFAGAWMLAYFFEEYAQHYRKNTKYFLILFFTFIWIYQLIPHLNSIAYVNRPEGFYTTNEGTTTVMGEYMPKWVNVVPGERAKEKMNLLTGQATLSPIILTTQKMIANIRAQEESVVQINTVYYPGWGATIDNQPVPIQYQNSNGLMRIRIPSGDHRLHVEFRETIPRFVADIVSGLFIILYIIVIIRSFYLKPKVLIKNY